MQKKASVAVWVWIAGGIIIASLVFLIAYAQMVGVSQVGAKQKALEAYEGLVIKADRLCTSFSGTRDTHVLLLSRDIEYIYSWENATLPANIEGLRASHSTTTGKMLCIKMRGESNHCEELDCNVTIPVMGYSNPDEDLLSLVLEILGREKGYITQDVVLERKGDVVECRPAD